MSVEEIKRYLAKEKCIPFIGAGASISAGGPTLQGYVKDMTKDLNPTEDIKTLLAEKGPDFERVAARIIRLRRQQRLPPPQVHLQKPGPIHELLAAFKAKMYLTTNYDDGIEQALNKSRIQAWVYKNHEFGIEPILAKDDGTVVLKLCCSSNFRDLTGAIGDEDLVDLIYDTPVVDAVVNLIRTNLIVFIGCSMKDRLVTSILDRAKYGKIGYVPPIAILPDDISAADRSRLEDWNVRVLTFNSKEKTASLKELLSTVKPLNPGARHLLIFEPGADMKLIQTLEAAQRVNPEAGFASACIITSAPDQISILKHWGETQRPPIHTEGHHFPDIRKSMEIVEAILPSSFPWNNCIAPNEYATLFAARFVESFNKQGSPPLIRFHSSKSTQLSRDKRNFRAFIRDEFKSHAVIKPIPFCVLKYPNKPDAAKLLGKIIAKFPDTSDVVLKPVDAAGSAGVRPVTLDTGKRNEAIFAIEDFFNAMGSFREDVLAKHCDVGQILVEKRIWGDEFSVECRIKGAGSKREVKTLAIHWKPWIDNDSLRFFERVYITVPENLDVHAKLSRCNAEILRKMDAGEGVFHAEYRMNESGVYPLEIAFRPGGGTVSNQVKRSHGVDIFESLIQSGLQIEPADPHLMAVVAAAEIFANKPGVLPPLSIRAMDGHLYAVATGDMEVAKRELQKRIQSISRIEAKTLLAGTLKVSTPFSLQVLDAFSCEGGGLRANMDFFDLWMKPGDIIIEEETTYVAGLQVFVDINELDGIPAVAEAFAAMAICYDIVECDPLARLQP